MCVPQEVSGRLVRFIWLLLMLRLHEPLAACRRIGWDVRQVANLVERGGQGIVPVEDF
jgi:hypothetical protein